MNEYCNNCEDRSSTQCAMPSRLERVISKIGLGFSRASIPNAMGLRPIFNEQTVTSAEQYVTGMELDVMVCVVRHQDAAN